MDSLPPAGSKGALLIHPSRIGTSTNKLKMLVNLRGIPIIPTKKVASPYVSLPLIHGISRVVTLILPSSPDASRKHNFYLPPKAAHLKARS